MSSEGDQEANAKSVLSAVEQDERMRTLVPALPVEEWGRKADKLETTVSTLAPSELTSIKPMARLPPDESAPKMRPPIFAKQSFDGVNSDSDEDSEDEILPLAGTLGRKIAEMKWSDGAPKIEEIDEEPNRKTKFGLGDDIDEQMRRRVWGDEDERDRDVPMEMNPDMGEEEEEFLRFSREALGISDDMWEGILRNRRERGGGCLAWQWQLPSELTQYEAFVPKPVAIPVHDATVERAPSQALKKAASTLPGIAKSTTITTGPATSLDPGSVNLELDSFEKVMAAMDVELAKVKTNSPAAPVISGKSKFDSLSTLPVEADLDKMNEDDLAAMDRELRAALQGAGADEEGIDDIGELDVEEARELEGEDRREYKMMRDFLESYRSQAGGSGVVGNLFGRLGKGDEAES